MSENKSAADVAAILKIGHMQRVTTGHGESDQMLCFSTDYGEVEKLKTAIAQAIQSETKALATENLELRAEIGRLRGLVEHIAPHSEMCSLTWGLDLNDGPEPVELVPCDCWKSQALSQPTPTGAGERFLKVAAAGYIWYKLDPDPKKACDLLLEAAEALTPEDIKILEGYGDA